VNQGEPIPGVAATSPIRTAEVLVTNPGRNFVTLRVAAYLPFNRLKDGTVHDW